MQDSCGKKHILPVNDFDYYKIIDVAEMFLSESFSKETYQKIADIAKEISSAKYAVFNLYEENGREYSSVAISGAGDLIQKASDILGFEIGRKKWGENPDKEEKIADSTITCFDTLRALTGETIPLPIVLLIEKTFNTGNIYIAKIVKNEKMLGDFTFICEKGATIINEELIDLFLKLTGLFITRKRTEEKLLKSHEQYMLAVNGNRDGIWDWDIITGSLFLSKRWKEIAGYSDNELESKLGVLESLLHPDDAGRFDKYLKRYLKGELKQYSIEFRMKHKDGTYRWILGRGEALYNERGIPYRMAGSHTDITEKKEMERKLESLAATDDLTGLWNRRYFFEIGHNECKRTKRYKTKFGLLMIDIDHFKKINDEFGHAAGDQVLKSIADIFRECLRNVDIPARIGGEEFAVLMPNTDIEGSKIVAERLRLAVESSLIEYEGTGINITISIGISDCTNLNTMDEMLKNADTALYSAKESGRNCVKTL